MTDDTERALWEEEAIIRIRQMLEHMEFDERRRVVIVDDPNEGELEFASIEDLRAHLVNAAESEMSAYAPYENGEPVFDLDGDPVVDDLLDEEPLVDFFSREPPFEREEDADQVFLFPPALSLLPGSVVAVDLSDINDELIKYLAAHPEMMHQLDPRKFEELVAALFRGKGYAVELTPPQRDGGRDLLAFSKNSVGTLLTLVECKRWHPAHPVGVGVVRSLYGVVEQERATMGIVATTSRFTGPARQFQGRSRYRISLRDFDDLRVWLSEHFARR